MLKVRSLTVLLSTGALLATMAAVPDGASADPRPDATAVAQAATHRVIVLLKDQPASVPVTSAQYAPRRAHLAASQAAVAKQLQAAAAKNIQGYNLINAVTATVSTAEQQQLQANSAVAAVIPDEVVKGSKPTAAAPSAADITRSAPLGACGTASKPLLEPEALSVTNTASADPAQKTARSLGFTGAGVKVAYMAEGIDINNPDFIRNGKTIFSDYKDFSGDGLTAPTAGGEAFLDASAIAAQGNITYNIQDNAAVALTQACDIRVEGMAPGVSLVGLKVFAETNYTLTSGILQAIQYAVEVDHVDVLSESFGSNPFPDSATADATRLFDEAAVQAGVTVTVSSGDAGPTNTIGSPATDPDVISVGGSTTLRYYAQTGYGGFYPLAKGGWLNNNISPLSSSGLSQDGRSIDLVAPGDLAWALCTPDIAQYADCTSLAGKPASVERSGGTSLSAPLTAGASALVIQAYRSTHHGANPTPALVKRLLTSTADDIDHPAAEQGAGLLNSYQAVLAAMSVGAAAYGSYGPSAVGSALLTDKTQLDAQGLPATSASWPLTLTNDGATVQTLSLGQRTLGPVLDSIIGSVRLSDQASPHFTDSTGKTTNYQLAHFTVPAGRDRLDVDYVYPGAAGATPNARVRIALLDPNGRFAGHSVPQGVGNAGHVDVAKPVAGGWTVMIWSIEAVGGGTAGTVTYGVSTHNYVATGSVTPATVALAPGQSRQVIVSSVLPAHPGDQTNSVTISSSAGHVTTVPVALRALVNINRGGTYAGVLTGGNGRQSNTGQGAFVQFDVPAGQADLTANLTLAQGATDPVFGHLVDPAGNVQAFAANLKVNGFAASTGAPLTTPISTMSLTVRAPAAGRWTLILDFAPAVSGTKLAVPFYGTVGLNTVRTSAGAVPNSAAVKLKARVATTVAVTVRNTSNAPESFFIDPRLNQTATVTLAPLFGSSFALPLGPATGQPEWTVPTETSKVSVGVAATLPVNFDFGWAIGDPDLVGTVGPKLAGAYTASGTYSASPVPPGAWFAAPAEIGPFPTAVPAANSQVAMTAVTRVFDPTVTTSIGNFEQSAVDPTTKFQVVNVAPGHSITISVIITPTGAKGTVVSGELFVDDLQLITVAGEAPSGQELAAIPYRYTIG